MYLARGGGSFDPSWRKVEVKILFNVWARGGGSFDPSWRKVEVKILFNVLARGDGGFVPHEDKQQKLRSYLSYWPKGGLVLIPHEDRFKVRSYSISFVKILFNVWARGGWQF